MSATRALFIALEGIDGSGKTTQQRRLLRRLSSAGLPAMGTSEPTERPIGALLRRFLSGEIPADPQVIAALFAADRLDHLLLPETGILASLDRGITVVTDRYYFSSYAYQSVDMPLEAVIQANARSAALRRPDVNLFLDLPPEEAMARIAQNREHREIYETRARLEAARERYLAAFARLGDAERVVTVPAVGDPDAVEAAVWNALRGFWGGEEAFS